MSRLKRDPRSQLRPAKHYPYPSSLGLLAPDAVQPVHATFFRELFFDARHESVQFLVR